jgi:stearoyl-CoA desaturase (delta-9 desaturase)
LRKKPGQLNPDRDLLAWQHHHHLSLMFIFAVALPVLVAGLGWGDWWGGFLVAFALRLAYQYHVTWSINSLSHTFGEKFYDLRTSATDGYFWIFRHVLGLVTLGEVYHNFHHRFANDYRNGPNWYDLDVSKWLIKLLSYCGLTWDLVKRPASELARAREETRLGLI